MLTSLDVILTELVIRQGDHADPTVLQYLDCKTVVFFVNALKRSSNERSGAKRRVRLGRDATPRGSGDDRRFAPSICDC